MNILLVGFMGTGKTSVARQLAQRTGWPCLDVDDEIVKRAGRSIPAIFKEEGETGFRDWESRVLAALLQGEDQIIAGGGGIVLRPANVAAMKARGSVVCLTATPETVFVRVGQDANRPNLEGRRSVAGVAALMSAREQAYREAADFLVATDDKTVVAIAAEILERLAIYHE